MSKECYISHDNLPKKPLRVIHRHNRLLHKIHKLQLQNPLDHEMLKKIFITVDGTNDYLCYNDLTQEQRDVFDFYPVLNYSTERVSTGTPKWNRLYSLKPDIDVYVTIHNFRIKKLPKYYIEHPFYQKGFINELIYDHIIADNDSESATVIGTEAYADMIEYISVPENKFKLLKGAKHNDKNYSDNKILELLFSSLCKCKVGIRGETGIHGEICWYIIYKK